MKSFLPLVIVLVFLVIAARPGAAEPLTDAMKQGVLLSLQGAANDDEVRRALEAHLGGTHPALTLNNDVDSLVRGLSQSEVSSLSTTALSGLLGRSSYPTIAQFQLGLSAASDADSKRLAPVATEVALLRGAADYKRPPYYKRLGPPLLLTASALANGLLVYFASENPAYGVLGAFGSAMVLRHPKIYDVITGSIESSLAWHPSHAVVKGTEAALNEAANQKVTIDRKLAARLQRLPLSASCHHLVCKISRP